MIMPVNNKWKISELLGACVDYWKKTGRRISFEYTLISGKNDTPADAKELADLLRGAFRKTDAPIHVNLIRVNEVKETGFKEGSTESANAFAKLLEERGIVDLVYFFHLHSKNPVGIQNMRAIIEHNGWREIRGQIS